MQFFILWDQRDETGGFVLVENEGFDSREAAEAVARSRERDFPWQILEAENPRQAVLMASGITPPPEEHLR